MLSPVAAILVVMLLLSAMWNAVSAQTTPVITCGDDVIRTNATYCNTEATVLFTVDTGDATLTDIRIVARSALDSEIYAIETEHATDGGDRNFTYIYPVGEHVVHVTVNSSFGETECFIHVNYTRSDAAPAYNPCAYDGQCSPHYPYTCECGPDTVGPHCCIDIYNGTYCGGHGECIPGGACQCEPGFGGAWCCPLGLDGTTCSGRGCCQDDGKCRCNSGYNGTTCEVGNGGVTNANQVSTTEYTTMAAIAGSVALVAVGAVVYGSGAAASTTASAALAKAPLASLRA